MTGAAYHAVHYLCILTHHKHTLMVGDNIYRRVGTVTVHIVADNKFIKLGAFDTIKRFSVVQETSLATVLL